LKTLLNILLILLLLILFAISHGKSTIASRNRFVANCYFWANLNRLNLAVASYAQEHSGIMPDSQRWADSLIEQEELLMKKDFITPSSFSSYGVYYNSNLQGKLYSDLEDEHVILFTTKGEWNASGTEKLFYERSSGHGISYVITLNGKIYRYNPDRKDFTRIKGDGVIDPNGLVW
jgi:hypothetical protein